MRMSLDDTLDQDPEKKRRFWKAHIQQWEHSGLSQVDYCKTNGLVPHRFTYWKKRLYQPPDTGVSFVPLQITDNLPVPVEKSSFNLFTPNGYRIEVGTRFDADTLRQLIGVVKTI
jgi:hypothetical protein